MDPFWLAIAFTLGFLIYQVGLPPLVGYLVAGFVLHAFGVEGSAVLQEIADLGVILLLFTIGLKLDLKSLIRREVWATASIHMLGVIGIFGLGIFALSLKGLPYFTGLSFKAAVLIAFALSFSSTVFAVKVLEEKAQMASLHGRVAIGILIMQDIFAVFFLTFSTGKIPSAWALAIPFALWGVRLLLFKILSRCGHGELLLLFGLFAALVPGAALFEWAGLKPDLGALIIGILLTPHPKSSELAKSLLSLKDLFLVGFFLTIGLSGFPDLAGLGVALLLVLAVPFKVAFFLFLMTRFRLRSRSALLGSLSLANYSEFGLIVAAVGGANGWISPEWLVIIAIALSLSFIIASPLNSTADAIYTRFKKKLIRLEVSARHPDDQPINPGEATVGIFGMGRIGTPAYDFMKERCGGRVLGFDFNAETVKNHKAAGRNVVLGDPTDPDFWVRMENPNPGHLVLLTMSKHAANLTVAKQLLSKGFPGVIAATAKYEDEVEELKEAGVKMVFNLFAEAGTGFAEDVWNKMEHSPLKGGAGQMPSPSF